MRLFIAINFDAQTKRKIIEVQNSLKKLAIGNFSHPDNIHLTLVFLGQIPPDKIDTIKHAMNKITIPQIDLTLNKIDSFKKKNTAIYWIGIKENTALKKLQKDLSQALIEADFNIDIRDYTPHITLARKAKLQNNFDINELCFSPIKTSINTISLMHSHRVDDILTYTELYRVP